MPLRHDRSETAVRVKAFKIGRFEREVSECTPDGSYLLVRELKELIEQAQFEQQFEGGGMDRVAAEIAEEIAVLFEDGDRYARECFSLSLRTPRSARSSKR